MATLGDIDEAMAILGRMLVPLQATLSSQNGRPGSSLLYAIGDLRANAGGLLQSGALGMPLLNCFALAFYAGATLVGMGAVRAAMVIEQPVGLTAVAVTTAGIRFSLGQEARILARTVFTSRDDVTTALARTNAAFDQAEEFAADNSDPQAFQMILALHAAVTRDLSERARPLPRMTAYAFPKSFPALALANRLYADGSRADELRAENKVIHPAFMPGAGRALSA